MNLDDSRKRSRGHIGRNIKVHQEIAQRSSPEAASLKAIGENHCHELNETLCSTYAPIFAIEGFVRYVNPLATAFDNLRHGVCICPYGNSPTENTPVLVYFLNCARRQGRQRVDRLQVRFVGYRSEDSQDNVSKGKVLAPEVLPLVMALVGIVEPF